MCTFAAKMCFSMSQTPQEHIAPLVRKRVESLRRWLSEGGYAAAVVPSNDPHGSEYVAEHWMCRAWLTGFDGSAGTAVVTMHDAALWTDSRYWLQAEEQLRDTGITLMREGEDGVPTPQEWLREKQADDARFVVWENPELVAADEDACLQDKPCKLILPFIDEDPFDAIWTDRPSLPNAPICVHPECFAGRSVQEKLSDIQSALGQDAKNSALMLSDLADIAWMLNLRGGDIPFNPVFYAYLALQFPERKGILFVDEAKLTPEAKEHLRRNNIVVMPYAKWMEARHSINCEEWLIPRGTSKRVTEYFQKGDIKATFIDSPLLKSIKNDVEQAGFRRAMERDGVAMVRLLMRLEKEEYIESQTELGVACDLEELRSRGENYRGLSFETISAYGPHGAIVHYEPTPATDVPLRKESFLLLDSGAQYADGTTDITRTVPLGTLTEEERTVYTLVLKGHIELAALRFPEKTYGLELDLAARRAMWKAGYDFGHGTGHGVGSYLCVHEGPQQIRKNLRACTQVPFVPGMTITDEPGIYVAGRFGVRIENLLLVVSDEETDFGRFCRFETLTLCPIDMRPVRLEMLTAEEIDWLNNYHAEVYSRLAPLLYSDEREWLKEKTLTVDH